MSTNDLAVIIVTWNVRDLVLDTLRTLYADLENSGLHGDVWVVDNASSDGTEAAVREVFPAAHVVASPDNLGFAAGNNLALHRLGFDDPANDDTPSAAFLLNPDTLVQPGAVRTLYDGLMSLPRAGLVGARLTFGDGTFQHGAFGFPGLRQLIVELLPVPGRLHESRFNGRYSPALYSGAQPFPVDHTLGATMMVRRETIRQVGLMDEGFFMYCEEIDWQMRMQNAGWAIYCVPDAHIIHLGGQSTGQVRAQSVINLWRSRLRLYDKHYGHLKVSLARLIIRLGMRRKVAQVRRDYAAGRFDASQRDALLETYRTVSDL